MSKERQRTIHDVLDDIDQDGYIIVDIRMMEQVTHPISGQTVWADVMSTQKFSFSETEGIVIEDAGLRINLRADSDGSRNMLFWPWSSIVHYTHKTNSKVVADKVHEAYEEFTKQRYAEQGIEELEHVLNGEGPHGPGCHCADDADVDGYPISTAEANPCDPEHHIAIMTHSDIWVCLECAAKWNDDGELIE